VATCIARCRSVNYAARPALRLMHEHIKPIRPYLDIGFSISRRHARGGKRGSQALKLQRYPLWRALQPTCAGGLHIDTKTQHLGPYSEGRMVSGRVSGVQGIDTMIPVTSAINIDQAIVHHQSSAFALIGRPRCLGGFRDTLGKRAFRVT
jgi:hypothetical protein